MWQSLSWALPISFSGHDLVTDKKVEFTKRSEAKGLVIAFMSSLCPCSNSHVGLLKDYKEKFKDFDFLVLHSNQNEELEASKVYFKTSLPDFLVLQDENAKWADEFKAFKTPHAFVLNAQGEVVYQGGVTSSAQASRADRKYLLEVLEDLQAGKKPRVSEGRTLGCMIQREKDE